MSSYVYGRRYNNFRPGKNSFNSNRYNSITGTTFNPYQPKTANLNNQHSYYSTINNLKKILQIKK